MLSTVLLVVVAVCSSTVLAVMQNITVKGAVMCDKMLMPNAHIELYEKDLLDPDDLLDDTTSNGKGEFEVFGSEDEVLCIEPYVRITHSCKVSKPGCKRVAEYVVPKDKIGGVYDMTFVTLDIHVDGEKETC